MKWQPKDPKTAALDGVRAGEIAAVSTTIAIAALGYIENRKAWQSLNALSHAVHGDAAYQQKTPSLKYTLTALAINDSAQLSWATLHQILVGRRAEDGDVAASLLGGALVSLIAYVVDYKIVPPRFTPGIEKHLSPRAVFAVYLVLALSLGLGALKRREK